MSDIEIEIDGKKFSAKPNEMIIQVADANGIYIPRFCYHKHLTIAANCRMCLVEVEKAPKPAPACATPVMAGMKVFTRSPKAIASQKAVMEFLLINHPLDCPICDQGGECELQDLSMGFGAPESFYAEGKRSVADENLGPLIATEMTRCIHCTRCVRFGNEVAGMPELGLTNRGGHVEISTYVNEAIHSDVSGNVIDLCPVGALTSKPYRFKARPWELNQSPSIAAHDCVGSNINVHTRSGEVMRVVPRENVNINLTWISDRDRFSYESLYHADRLKKPLVKVQGQWRETDWQSAVDVAIGKLQKTLSAHDVNHFGALATPNATVEEFYLLQKLMRAVGSSNIDHRLNQTDFQNQQDFPLFPGMSESFNDIEKADAIILMGSNIQKEQPLLSIRLRQAVLKGTKVFVFNMLDNKFNFDLAGKVITTPNEFPHVLAQLAKALGENLSIETTDNAKNLATQLREKKNIKILLGASAIQHPQASLINSLANALALQLQATVGMLTEGCNTAGAWISGVVPHRGAGGSEVTEGLNAQTMLEKCKAFLLLNVEPDCDVANPVLMEKALAEAETVIALSTFRNPILEKHAHVILPIAPFTETSGTFVNAEGTWQSFQGVAKAFEESRPAWKVLRVLANWLKLENFDYKSSEDVRDEVRELAKISLSQKSANASGGINSGVSPSSRENNSNNALNNSSSRANDSNNALDNSSSRENNSNNALDISSLRASDSERSNPEKLTRISETPIYAVDALTRRSEPLQQTQEIIDPGAISVRVHPEQLEKLGFESGEMVTIVQKENRIQLPILADRRVPKNCALIPNGLRETSGLSELFGVVELRK